MMKLLYNFKKKLHNLHRFAFDHQQGISLSIAIGSWELVNRFLQYAAEFEIIRVPHMETDF
jgi:hypothetical protein